MLKLTGEQPVGNCRPNIPCPPQGPCLWSMWSSLSFHQGCFCVRNTDVCESVAPQSPSPGDPERIYHSPCEHTLSEASSLPGLGLNSTFLPPLSPPHAAFAFVEQLTAVSHWWPHPKSGPGLWFQSSVHTHHMDNPAVTWLLGCRGLELEVHMEIFFCVCAGFAKRPVLIIHLASWINEKGETSKVAKFSVLVTNTEGFFLMYNQKVGLRFTPLICGWLFFLIYKKERNSCFLQLTVFFLKRNRHREITYLWRLLSKKTISIHIKKLIQRN